jgi:hypothetical protein
MRKSSSFHRVFTFGVTIGLVLISACSIFGGSDDSSSASSVDGGEDAFTIHHDAGTSRRDSGTSSSDGGVLLQSDGGFVHDDAGHVIGSDGGALLCDPQPLGSFSGGSYSPPKAPLENVCTSTDIANYVSCFTATDTSQCAQFESSGTSANCGACLLTPTSASQWGATIGSSAAQAEINVPGCYAYVFNEGASATGCGGSLQHDFNCQSKVCDPTYNCAGATPDELQTCDDTAISGACAAYDSIAQTECNRDGGPLQTLCSITDETSLTTFLSYACGNGS